MPKIKLEDADTLYQLFVELGAVTYLQGLLQYDIRENALGQEDLRTKPPNSIYGIGSAKSFSVLKSCLIKKIS